MQAVGTLYLGGIQFTTDPATYQPFNWPKRLSVVEGLEGSVTVLDFGRTKKDNVVHIESGDQFLDHEVTEALDTLFDVPGATYTLTDWLGNEYEVAILEFKPLPSNLPDLDEDGEALGALYRYSMELRVLDIVTRRGVAYVGS